MKHIISALLMSTVALITLSSCAITSTYSSKEVPLIGEVSQQRLLTSNQSFNSHFEQVKISENDKKLIKQWPNNIHIDIFFATWCHDSEREVPTLLGILQQRPELSFKLIALDDYKSDPKGLSTVKNVKYTPTIIIYMEGKEVGRIIERPTVDLISDITKLLKLG